MKVCTLNVTLVIKSNDDARINCFTKRCVRKPEDYMAFDDILHQNNATALVVIDDIFALRTMQLAQIYGYQVPETLSIISFNNSIFSTLTHPYLTSIDIDTSELGRMAMKII